MTPHRQWAASPRRVSSAAAPAARRFDGTPAAPGLLPTAVLSPDRGPGVGRRTKRDQREAVSLSTGLVPKHHPKSSRPPPGRPEGGSHRLTTRPSREPCLTGLSLAGDEPAAFDWPRAWERMSIGTARDSAPGTAAQLRGAGPPESA